MTTPTDQPETQTVRAGERARSTAAGPPKVADPLPPSPLNGLADQPVCHIQNNANAN
jgi:hypothetical protein